MNNIFSFKQIVKFIFGLALSIQIILLSYNHITGYHELKDLQDFILRVLFGTLLSSITGFLIAYPDLSIIGFLNRIAPWHKNIIKRIAMQLGFTFILATIISIAITFFSNWFGPYKEEFTWVLINNILIYCVVNLIIMIILEGWIFYNESIKAKNEAKILHTELSQIKFEVLKSQINPHFMFNSLNVLSGLINIDIEKAQLFIDEFSQIYRYVLESIERPVVSLSKELDFMRSYLFLQQIRFGEMLSFSVDIPANLLQMVLPPLSLQVVLENAIKHNIINESKPLRIDLYIEGAFLVVKNNIQPKISASNSTGLGLKNLEKRYALISKFQPVFYVKTDYYIAKLPLISTDCDENINN